jgi:hypothetical protein
MSTVNVNRVVDASGGVLAPISSVMRNRIINGAMVIDQRNAGASTTPASDGIYNLDRWQARMSTGSKFSVQQNAGSVTPPVGFNNYLGITSTSSYSASSSDFFVLEQVIEGFNVQDLAWGTANAKTVTLSFQVYSSKTGTFGGSLFNNAANRSYPFTYTIASANTWTSASVTIAGDTSGSWTQTNGAGIYLNFDLGSGTSRVGTAGAWAGATYWGASGCQSIVATSGATFYITGVQLEVGTQATSFEYRQYGQELALCQRYFEMVFKTWGTWTATNAFRMNGRFSVRKRTQATATQYATTVYAENYGVSGTSTSSPVFGTNFGGSDFYDIPITGFSTAFATNTVGVAGNNSDTSTWADNFVGFSAEL